MQLAFVLPHSEIRCTSAYGFQLSVGTNIHERIKQEVRESEIFIAIITPSSIKSTYVLFELGARWGVGLPLFPLLGRGARVQSLEDGPLGVVVALNLADRDEVVRLIEEVGDALNQRPSKISSLTLAINDVVAAAKEETKEVATSQADQQEEVEIQNLSLTNSAAYGVLEWLFDTDERAMAEHIADALAMHVSIAKHCLDVLTAAQYVDTGFGRDRTLYGPTRTVVTYRIAAKGRSEVLKARGLLT